MNSKTKINNRIWQARHKIELEQKRIAFLLGHQTLSQISCYERGDKMPNLKNALKLELILQTPVSDLFPEHYQICRAEVVERNDRLQTVRNYDNEIDPINNSHICTYGNLLLQRKPTEEQIRLARAHSIDMIQRFGEMIHRR